jgi:hypothetical protein
MIVSRWGALGIAMRGPDGLGHVVTAIFRAPLWQVVGEHRYGALGGAKHHCLNRRCRRQNHKTHQSRFFLKPRRVRKHATMGKKRKAKAPKEPKAKKVSALDAAAQVLAAAGEPMNTRQMIEAMAAKKLWTSPGGKTPHATLYSAILRELNEKGKDARFVKTERGKFAAKAA